MAAFPGSVGSQGLSPAKPQYPAGERMEPHVSEPIAKGTSPADTAAPDPLEDPPVHAFASHGLMHGPVNDAVGWR